MKIIAINEIHYTDSEGKEKIALPGSVFDRPKADAELLLRGALPAARRLTDAEVELDKLRAQAITAGSTTTDEDDDEYDEGDEQDKVLVKATAKTETKTAAKTATKSAEKTAKGDGEGY